MIIGTWNLEVYRSRHSALGIAMAEELNRHLVDVWFLTELHADWEVRGHNLCLAPPREGALETRRFAGIATSFHLEPIAARDDPVEGWMCLARLTDPRTSKSCLAASIVLPWRGITPYWRQTLGRDVTYPESFHHVLAYIVGRIEDERCPGEDVIWGGDFNQALSGRDYVGTHQGRSDLEAALNRLGLQAPTANLPALGPTQPTIDHIAVPTDWSVRKEPTVHRPTRNQKPLSDHALYLVDAGPAATGHEVMARRGHCTRSLPGFKQSS